jgi:hypothetical protein
MGCSYRNSLKFFFPFLCAIWRGRPTKPVLSARNFRSLGGKLFMRFTYLHVVTMIVEWAGTRQLAWEVRMASLHYYCCLTLDGSFSILKRSLGVRSGILHIEYSWPRWLIGTMNQKVHPSSQDTWTDTVMPHVYLDRPAQLQKGNIQQHESALGTKSLDRILWTSCHKQPDCEVKVMHWTVMPSIDPQVASFAVMNAVVFTNWLH